MNRNQILAAFGAVLGVLVVSSAQLTDLFGAGVAKYVISMAGLLNAILSAVMLSTTGQAQTMKDVSRLEGVESIKINANANSTIAAVALDPKVENVEPSNQQAENALVRKTGG